MSEWMMPTEPGPEVKAIRVDGDLWVRNGHADYPWCFGGVCTTWPMVLSRGSAVDATDEIADKLPTFWGGVA